MKDGGDGMALLNDLPNKSAIETHLKSNDKLQGQFKEIAQMANLLQMIGQTGPDSRPGRLSTLGATSATPAARYAQQSNSVEKRAEATFVLNVMSGGNASYSFE